MEWWSWVGYEDSKSLFCKINGCLLIFCFLSWCFKTSLWILSNNVKQRGNLICYLQKVHKALCIATHFWSIQKFFFQTNILVASLSYPLERKALVFAFVRIGETPSPPSPSPILLLDGGGGLLHSTNSTFREALGVSSLSATPCYFSLECSSTPRSANVSGAIACRSILWIDIRFLLIFSMDFIKFDEDPLRPWQQPWVCSLVGCFLDHPPPLKFLRSFVSRLGNCSSPLLVIDLGRDFFLFCIFFGG